MSSRRIILFRFHKDTEIARERIKILRHFNPDVPIHVLYGGNLDNAQITQKMLSDVIESFWAYTGHEEKEWKWLHTDIMTKAWYRDIGHTLSFDYMYSYEYDLLTLASLENIYPEIKKSEIALAAAEPFTKEIENKWYWTSREPEASRYRDFCKYMETAFTLGRQQLVCLGPGPLLSKEFLDMFSRTEDID